MSIEYESYNICLEPYYDNINNYYHILTINKKPKGPLSKYVRLINIKNVSTKISKLNESYCSYVINNTILESNKNYQIQICTIEDITNILDFLNNNNYIINETITNILDKFNSKKLLINFKYKIN